MSEYQERCPHCGQEFSNLDTIERLKEKIKQMKAEKAGIRKEILAITIPMVSQFEPNDLAKTLLPHLSSNQVVFADRGMVNQITISSNYNDQEEFEELAWKKVKLLAGKKKNVQSKPEDN